MDKTEPGTARIRKFLQYRHYANFAWVVLSWSFSDKICWRYELVFHFQTEFREGCHVFCLKFNSKFHLKVKLAKWWGVCRFSDHGVVCQAETDAAICQEGFATLLLILLKFTITIFTTILLGRPGFDAAHCQRRETEGQPLKWVQVVRPRVA